MHSALTEGRGIDERWHLRENGERFWANGEIMALRNEAGAAIGFVKILRDRFKVEPAAVTGPATDNKVGVDIIEEQMKVRAFNAITNGAALGDHLISVLGLATKFPAQAKD